MANLGRGLTISPGAQIAFFTEIKTPRLPAQAQMPPDEGGICTVWGQWKPVGEVSSSAIILPYMRVLFTPDGNSKQFVDVDLRLGTRVSVPAWQANVGIFYDIPPAEVFGAVNNPDINVNVCGGRWAPGGSGVDAPATRTLLATDQNGGPLSVPVPLGATSVVLLGSTASTLVQRGALGGNVLVTSSIGNTFASAAPLFSATTIVALQGLGLLPRSFLQFTIGTV